MQQLRRTRMVKVLSGVLVVAVVCLVAVSLVWAGEKKEPPSVEQVFKNFGGEDGKLTKEAFVAAAKKRATDKRPFNEERTLGFWKRLAGDKDSITFDEFKAKWKEVGEGFRKRGKKREQ